MATTLSDPLIGQLVDGRYEVVRRIARGGMATVYLARDRRLERDVALKVMHPHLAEGTSGADFVARFRREARAAARLAHHGLVGVFDQGVDGDTSYLTMEYVEGTNLRRRLGDQGALTVGEALQVAAEVLDALTAAHHAGLVHRDIKPENVLIGLRGQVKVADFGLARAVTEVTSTTTGTILGTVAYLAPELVAHGISDTRTDVYAVGILLFEMLTGSQPFTGATPIQIAYQHVNSDVPAPSDRVDWLPLEIDELVGALAARDPAERPLDASAALEVLRRTRAVLDEATLERRADVLAIEGVPDEEGTGRHRADAGDDDEGDPAGAALPPHTDGADPDATETMRVHDPDATERLDLGRHSADPEPAVPEAMSRTIALRVGEVLEAPSEPAPRRTRRLGWLLVPLVLVLALGGTAWWYVTEGPGAWTTVPGGLVRATYGDADAVLTAQGLGVDATNRVFDPVIPKGSVVATHPDEGQPVRKDGTVSLDISKGPEMTTVPAELAGKPVADVVAALKAARFTVPTPLTRFDDTVAKGDVLGIATADGPAADGAELPVGTKIVVTVSDGPQPVTVPSVLGEDAAAAKKQLEELGLKVAKDQGYTMDYPAGAVMAQSIDPKTEAHRTDTITITISQGPPLVKVPNVRGDDEKKATKALEGAGFVVDVQYSLFGHLYGSRVVSQDPSGDTELAQGSTVTTHDRLTAQHAAVRTHDRADRLTPPLSGRGASPPPGTPSPGTAGGSGAGRPRSRSAAPGPRRRSARCRPSPR